MTTPTDLYVLAHLLRDRAAAVAACAGQARTLATIRWDSEAADLFRERLAASVALMSQVEIRMTDLSGDLDAMARSLERQAPEGSS